mgnify:FL=1
MKKFFLFCLFSCICAFSTAKMLTYTIVSGGGVDDRFLGLMNHQGQEIHSYCLDQCGNWFEPSTEHEGETLKSKYKGQKVSAKLSYEINNDRIVGPGDDEKLYFIQKIKLLSKAEHSKVKH